ncbi:sigma factor G inhibitor Gin [Clostridium brassicae]|uniref:Sigma factor G inhibitor Gin n=1 Tax=Clostridium brassicae TaxID=2999072 RepID=A0ABT4DE87_9CLOT|nr:sigma factor G inhibitor Gin [Clostridium brassicae]MCY6960629.1 sigma factor G inhibitor Gin [Clostridium brassicae]
MKKQKCIICRKPLNDGIMIYRKGICKNCEERIINTDQETDFYNHYICCIKKNVSHWILRGEDYKCQNYLW